MHVKAKFISFGGLLLVLTVLFVMLGGIIETNTLFLLAAASYFAGIMIRETGLRMGAAFYLAGVLLGFILVPNKFYVLSYAAMGFYSVAAEFSWRRMGNLSGTSFFQEAVGASVDRRFSCRAGRSADL